MEGVVSAGELCVQRSEDGRSVNVFEEVKEDLCSWSVAEGSGDGAGERRNLIGQDLRCCV